MTVENVDATQESKAYSPRRKGLLYFLMFIITLVFLFVTGEIVARFFVKLESIPEPPPARTFDPYKENTYILQVQPYVYYHIPGSKYTQARSYYEVDYEINSMGLRGPEIHPKSDDIKRLIVISDSIGEGHGNPLEKAYPYLLGESLREHGWEVINMSVQGASPIYYAANVKRYLSVEPDAVLLMTFENEVSDDRIIESVYFTFPILDDEEALLMKTTTRTLLSKSHLYLLLQKGWRYFVHSPVEELIRYHSQVTYSEAEKEAMAAFDKLSPLGYLVAPEVLDKQWRMTQTYLDYTVSSFEEQGIPVMIANLALIGPYFNQVHRDYVYSLDEKIAGWAKTEKLPFFSLLPVINNAFKEHPHSKISIEDDGHPTPYTHALIERTLRPWVIKNLEIE
jgi:lysophospholipase L1-like esterase